MLKSKSKFMFITLIFMMLAIAIFTTSQFTVDSSSIRTVRVGYLPNFNTVIENIDSVNSKGYGYEVFEKISENSDLNFEFIPISSDIESALERREVDVGGFFIMTPQRSEQLAYSQTAFGKEWTILASEEDYPYDDPASINGKTVATYEENIANIYFSEYLDDNNIEVEFLYGDISDYTDIVADFHLLYGRHSATQGKNNVLNIRAHNLYLVSSLENEALLSRIEDELLKVVFTEGSFFSELEEKYQSSTTTINHRDLTADELELLRSRPLSVGYISDKSPISYQNLDGQADGAMVETLRHLASRYEFDIEFSPYDINSDHSHFDILVTLYGNQKVERQTYSFTEPFYNMGMYAQIHGDIYRQDSKLGEVISNSPKIGMLEYLTIDYDSFIDSFPDNEIIFYDEFNLLLDDFSNGNLDVAVSTESATSYSEIYLSDHDSITVPLLLEVPMQFLISNEISSDYLPIFNVMLDNFSDYEYNGIITNHNNDLLFEPSFLDFVIDNWIYFALALILIILGFVFLHYLEQKKQKKILEHAYKTDELTGVMSLAYFRKKIDDLLQKGASDQYELISVDIDMFKSINSYFSYERGSQVIQALAKGITEATKDTSTLISRRTADQFLFFMRTADKINMREIYNYYILPEISKVLNDKYHLSLSFGIYTIKDCKLKIDDILSCSDTARLQGKKTHKTSFIYFDESMQKDFEQKQNITFRMEQALQDKEFKIVYQPKVDFKTLRMGAAEALVRWHPKIGDTIYPSAFISVFEENGFISELDKYVLEEVCIFIKKNRLKLAVPVISVNISSHSLADKNFLSSVLYITNRHQIEPEKIEFEISENSAASHSGDDFLEKIHQLKKAGFRVSIDDFGAGLSSLNRLSTIEADALKLDKKFFNVNEKGERNNAVVEGVLKIAKNLNMETVAEGVETFGQVLWLKGLKCEYAQGYYFEKPLAEDEFKTLIQSKKKYPLLPN